GGAARRRARRGHAPGAARIHGRREDRPDLRPGGARGRRWPLCRGARRRRRAGAAVRRRGGPRRSRPTADRPALCRRARRTGVGHGRAGRGRRGHRPARARRRGPHHVARRQPRDRRRRRRGRGDRRCPRRARRRRGHEMSRLIRIGAGSAWWGDRIEPAAANAERGELDYLCFETMAEATVSAAQVRARRDSSFPGYDTWLDDRMKAVLPGCMRHGTRIVTNQGWINPRGAAERIAHWLREFGHRGVKVAAVDGSLITDRVLSIADAILENGAPVATLADTLVS